MVKAQDVHLRRDGGYGGDRREGGGGFGGGYGRFDEPGSGGQWRTGAPVAAAAVMGQPSTAGEAPALGERPSLTVSRLMRKPPCILRMGFTDNAGGARTQSPTSHRSIVACMCRFSCVLRMRLTTNTVQSHSLGIVWLLLWLLHVQIAQPAPA